MPIWLRKFTYSKISETLQQQANSTADTVGKSGRTRSTLIDSSGNINKEEALKFNVGKINYS